MKVPDHKNKKLPHHSIHGASPSVYLYTCLPVYWYNCLHAYVTYMATTTTSCIVFKSSAVQNKKIAFKCSAVISTKLVNLTCCISQCAMVTAEIIFVTFNSMADIDS